MGDDGQERILNAIDALASSSEPIQQRLEVAGISLLPLQSRDFNEPDTADLFTEIMRAMTTVSDPTGERGDLAVTVSAMTDSEAERVASLIVDLHRRVYPW